MKRLLSAAAFVLLAADALAAPTVALFPNGAVEVRGGPAEAWRAASAGESLAPGTEVRTTGSSTARLNFSDGSIVQLNPNTIFAIDKTDAKEASFSLKLGKLKAAFAGLFASRIAIHTPTAVCAVRGTVFEMGADPQGTQVKMAEGTLEVKDNQGKQAVVTSEETLNVGPNGMDKPKLLGLHDEGSLQAVRPYQVGLEMNRDATRTMLETLRNRELKANEAQLGKDAIDAYGRRVRIEEYLLRPDSKSFELLFLSLRQSRFDWGHFIETFNATIPDDLSRVPGIIQGSFLSASQPTNWLKSMEFYATNTIDGDKELVTLGNPVQINFSGFGKGQLWYPASIDFTQTLSGPGVPGGSRVQFSQHQDWNATNAGVFTWSQSVQPNATAVGAPSAMFTATLNPTVAADVAGGFTTAVINNAGLYNNTNTFTDYPSGPTKADLRQTTVYSDNAGLANSSSVTVEKFLVSNDGHILDFASPKTSDYTKSGSYNIEINVKSSLFQSRDIDVLIAPEILRQKSQQTAQGSSIGQ